MTRGHVMIVDDDDDIREMTGILLEASGFDVTEATDGADAVRKLEGGAEPSVILLDLMMPRMDGEKFLHELRHGPRAKIPVVVMSGHNLAASRAGDLKADACLTKPVDLESLLGIVEKLLAGPR